MRLLLVNFLLALLTGFVVAQQEATTSDGKKVILNPDGTWKYVNPLIAASTDTMDPNDCANWTYLRSDKMTGDSYLAMKAPLIVSKDGETGFKISLLTSKDDGIILSILTVGASSCIDDKCKINILFTDGTRLELRGDNKYNCKGMATVYFGGILGKKKELNLLKTKKIETMRVWTASSYVQEDFTEENRNVFYYSLNCLNK